MQLFTTLKWIIVTTWIILAFAMKPVIAVVRVTCQCGKWIIIRGVPGTIKVCWECGRQVWFILRGWMTAVGKVKDSEGNVHDTDADVTWMGTKK